MDIYLYLWIAIFVLFNQWMNLNVGYWIKLDKIKMDVANVRKLR